MNKPQKFIYLIDRWTPIFGSLEVARANWFAQKYELSKWFEKKSLILDIGSGVGDITKKIKDNTSGRVIAIDIEDFRRRGNRQQNSFDFIIADAKKQPLKSDHFDCATLFWTLHHTSDPMSIISEVNRILKRDGEIIILEDIIDDRKGFRGYFTRFYDKAINLEFVSHPHMNFSINQWHDMIIKSFDYRCIQLSEKPWFTPFKLLKFGLLRFVKN